MSSTIWSFSIPDPSAARIPEGKLPLDKRFRSARELQQAPILESFPEIPGYSLTSAYKAAVA
jgi:hypothetical protein